MFLLKLIYNRREFGQFEKGIKRKQPKVRSTRFCIRNSEL